MHAEPASAGRLGFSLHAGPGTWRAACMQQSPVTPHTWRAAYAVAYASCVNTHTTIVSRLADKCRVQCVYLFQPTSAAACHHHSTMAWADGEPSIYQQLLELLLLQQSHMHNLHSTCSRAKLCGMHVEATHSREQKQRCCFEAFPYTKASD